MVHTDHRAEKERWAGVYGRGAGSYRRVAQFVHWGRRLVEHLPLHHGAHVLDVATGRGACLFPAARKIGLGGVAVGIDLSAPMAGETAAEASAEGLTNVRVLVMDAERLAFAQASFDAILAGFALFFLPRPRQAFAEMARVLKPGGAIGVTTPGPRPPVEPQGAAGLIWDLLETYRDKSPTLRLRMAVVQETYRQAQGLPWPDRQSMASWSWPSRSELEAVLAEAGFIYLEVHEEDADIVAADADEWWSWQWAHMPRSELELLEPEVLQQLKTDAFARLRAIARPDGIHGRSTARITLAHKPG